MQHSVKYIGSIYEQLSNMRNDIIKFNIPNFLNFAKQNTKKYQLIEGKNGDFFVSTWFSDALINDYIIQSNIK